jgi:hypothetical protein
MPASRRLALLLCLAASGRAAKKATKKAEVADELLYLTDSTLEEALNGHRLLLISVNVRTHQNLCLGGRLLVTPFLSTAAACTGIAQAPRQYGS